MTAIHGMRTTPLCQDECVGILQDTLARLMEFPTEVHVSSEPPLIEQQHAPLALYCPHGVTWYVVPTTEQIAAWAEAGVE